MPNLKDFYSTITRPASNLRAVYAFMLQFEFYPSLDDGEQEFGDALVHLAQGIVYPDIGLGGGQAGSFESSVEASTFMGSFRTPAQTGIKARADSLTIDYLDTDLCLHEKFIIPWMEGVVGMGANGTTWADNFPFKRANIRAYVYSTTNFEVPILEYDITGAYPVLVDSPKFRYGPNETMVTRAVGFEFNNVRVVATAPAQKQETQQQR